MWEVEVEVSRTLLRVFPQNINGTVKNSCTLFEYVFKWSTLNPTKARLVMKFCSNFGWHPHMTPNHPNTTEVHDNFM